MVAPTTLAIPLSPTAVAATSGPAAPAGAEAFADTVARLVGSVDASTGTANAAVERMLAGEGDVHEALIALQQAETGLQLSIQVRNKLVQAYQDIMRMPV